MDHRRTRMDETIRHLTVLSSPAKPGDPVLQDLSLLAQIRGRPGVLGAPPLLGMTIQLLLRLSLIIEIVGTSPEMTAPR